MKHVLDINNNNNSNTYLKQRKWKMRKLNYVKENCCERGRKYGWEVKQDMGKKEQDGLGFGE